MIGRLSGTLISKHPPDILVDVGGVGYEVQVPMTTLYALPAVGERVLLLTHLVVREDAQILFGFGGERERQLFRELIKVNGVGPRLALTILSGMDAAAFVRCIQGGDLTALTRLPGVGKKTAERLLIEMRDRLKDWLNEIAPAHAALPTAVAPQSSALADAESALVTLGYKPQEASRMVAAVNTDPALGCEDLIRRALQAAVAR